MTVRTVAPVRLLAHLLVGLVAATLLALPAGGASAATGAGAERASAPSYGAWSGYYYDLRARVALPTKSQPRAYAQVNRNARKSGDRQVKLTWRSTGGTLRTTAVRTVQPRGTVTLMTSALPCGKTRATLMARGRAPGGGAWSEWKSASAVLTRSC